MPIEMVCDNCAQPFYCYPSEAEKGRRYCGLKCRSAHLHKKGLSAESRTPISFSCKECGAAFVMMQAYLTAYRKKFGRDPLYCSLRCSAAGRRRSNEERNRFVCVNCGKEQMRHRNQCGRIYTQQKVCSKQCKNEWTSKLYRAKHGLPATSRRVKRGYVVLRIPAGDNNPTYEILEHRYNMEQHLGRKLRDNETVHHRNGDKQDNSLSNLELFGGNHGPGQRVVDKIAFAIEVLRLYPEFAAAEGVQLVNATHDPKPS